MKSIPLSYQSESSIDGIRIGGSFPEGMEDEAIDGLTQYFGTFPLLSDCEKEFSIFHRFEIFGDDELRDVIDHNNKILEPSNLIWVAVHPKSHRGDFECRPFEPRSLIAGNCESDLLTDEEGHQYFFSESKLGGKAFLERHWLNNDIVSIEKEGFVHLLQIGMHGSDLVDGFPWDPGYLHVWASDDGDPTTYRFLIEQ